MRNIQILVHIGLLYFVKKNEIVNFDSFGVEHIPEEIKEFIGNKNIKTNIYCVQANDSVMCGYFCIEFIDFMLAGKTLINYTASIIMQIWLMIIMILYLNINQVL